MKRAAVVVLVFLSSFTALFSLDSSDFFHLYFGANLSFDKITINDPGEMIDNETKNLLSVGLDAHMYFKFVQLGFAGNISVFNKQALIFNGVSYIGVRTLLFNRVNVGFSFGPNVNYMIKDEGGAKYVDGEGDVNSSIESYFSALFQGYLSYRFTSEFLINPVMKVGLAVVIPTHFNLQEFKIIRLWPQSSDFKSINVSLSIHMRLI